MPVTTPEQEYKRLRSYLNPFIKGPNVDAVLTALASGNSSYLINNVNAVNDQLYIATASGQYLDERLSDFNIVRPPQVGLSDDVFRQIGIAVKNRKQVRDLINEILDAIFGDEFVRASNPCKAFEPYHLFNGDTLIVNFDEANTTTITFSTNEFENIATAKAQEVADAITKSLRNSGLKGTAIAKDDGNGLYVEILSDTIGAVSSVTVLGGSAQNQLKFDAPVPAGGNASTQWTLTVRPGGVMRFTWTGGANPNLGRVAVGNYVNVFGGGFLSSSNIGSYAILKSVGGLAGASYFEIENPLGSPGVIVEGVDNAVLFYNPIRKTVTSRSSYAVVYQTQNRVLQIFIPASTKVIRRERPGSAHLHDPPRGTFALNANPNPGDQFAITSIVTLTAGADFAIGGTPQITAINLAAAINNISGLVSTVGTDRVSVFNDSLSNTLVISYTGAANIVASGPLGDQTSLQLNQQGPYIYDLTQPFTISDVGTTLNQNLDGTMSRVINVKDSSLFPDDQGYVIFDYGTQEQEGPVPYIGRPSSTTLLISPAYTIKNVHSSGTDVALVAVKAPVDLPRDGSAFEFFVTDVVSGRIYAQNLINDVAATGINIIFTILYPGDIGLGAWGTPYSEIVEVWGP